MYVANRHATKAFSHDFFIPKKSHIYVSGLGVKLMEHNHHDNRRIVVLYLGVSIFKLSVDSRGGEGGGTFIKFYQFILLLNRNFFLNIVAF